MGFSETFQEILLPAIGQTFYMVIVSTILAVIIGFIPAILLVVTEPGGLKPNKVVYKILDAIVNLLRSFPFIILMIAIFPFTKLIVGKTIGTTAAIVPITIAAAPFASRVIESSLKEIDPGIIEAAKSFGASNMQIIFKVMIKEALPSIVLGITLTVISVVGCSAMAGTVGGGGLGDVAVKYGYYRFQTDIMVYTVIILIIFVQVLQTIGNLIYKKLNK
ncbi:MULTISPECIES: methionine ABC transporter permease [Clostridium]|uniref:Methionine import system permease protein MetP n=4 Tax=Clostridium TaxID=1485 RepID=D8GMD3_CLOLD|nr:MULTISPECIES: methionine ABC transporter permease [Clostridium]ADK13543.1 predicted ABC-type metal ion transport system, permease component [Clostridium ljungdahlii DSM 13528]AGY76742.1 ABC transporter permease [Clostridium autoethanogenum DSM 10061]ALU36896.1 Methionine ABC transporter permease [Clostridium autoethanogenum DSM 10061]AZV55465.1 ABC transporter permease [Clostridium sp. AWRP]OAA89161.1 Methionine import system permease protein MetP [Clostridium ljungdahlii DSM 13528]